MTTTAVGGPRGIVASLRRVASKAAGAVSGQLTQALGSFVIQALAARELGVSGFGIFALMYGSIVLGTALSSGLIGDSLTVLARENRPVRAALQNWCLIVSTGCGVVAVVAGLASRSISIGAAITFGLVTTVFIIEDALRRALMAVLEFWRLPLVDLASLVASLGYLILCSALGAHPTVGQFLLALLIGQALAALVAIPLLPRRERPILAARTREMQSVFTFGVWRAGQQSIRPALLTAARLVVTVILGVAIYGRLEAARVYMAPALLVVSGLGSMMLPMWVKHRADGLPKLLRRADRTTAALFGVTLVLGALGTALVPVLGDLLTDGKYSIEAAAVFGWAVYAASTAAVTPYGTLAALQGKQGRVLGLRLVEPVLALAILVFALLVLHLSATWTPYALSIGALASGLSVRAIILAPMAHPSSRGRHARGRTRPNTVTTRTGQHRDIGVRTKSMSSS